MEKMIISMPKREKEEIYLWYENLYSVIPMLPTALNSIHKFVELSDSKFRKGSEKIESCSILKGQ